MTCRSARLLHSASDNHSFRLLSTRRIAMSARLSTGAVLERVSRRSRASAPTGDLLIGKTLGSTVAMNNWINSNRASTRMVATRRHGCVRLVA